MKEPSRRRGTPTHWGGGPRAAPSRERGPRVQLWPPAAWPARGTPRDPTQAPVTLNRTRPTLGSPPSALLPAPRGTQFPGEP